ncbi:Fur family transcriptional regulator [Longirhabdus pacifica]|uniref:Fur family transcriptional regulator n=1 Tax=Longirhabdus pacifica TaxID=2305227 RepID=UPI001008BAD8|nr:Fur family transcriptional regulator [Longirhabdus pacifica]
MASDLEHALDQLKKIGVRMTPQRHAILTYLLNTRVHPSVDEIYKSMEPKFPSMSIATIYNNLKLFIDADLVRELTYGDGASRYDAVMSDHYHAICTECGKISDFEMPPQLDAEHKAHKETGYQIHSHRLEVYGVCPHCSEMKAAKH